jgi:hypothetical protein
VFASLMFMAGAASAVEPTSGRDSPAFDPKLCKDYADPIRVRIGGTQYHIPDIYKPDLTRPYPEHQPEMTCTCRNQPIEGSNLLEVQRGYCQAKDTPPFELTHVHIRQWNFRRQEHSGSNIKSEWQPLNPAYNLLMAQDVTIEGGYRSDPVQTFCKKKHVADRMVARIWRPYKEAENYYESGEILHTAGDDLTGQSFYYSDKYRLFGMPVIIQCDKPEDIYSFGSIGRSCQFISPISDSDSVYVRFHDKEFLPSEWGAGLGQLEAFLRSIMVTPPADIKFTSCD